MSLKVVLLDFNGVIIDDELIHQESIAEIMLGENLRSDRSDYKQYCEGKSDRTCLREILANRGRVVPEDYLTKLINAKTQAYQQKLAKLETLPLYDNVSEFLSQLQEQKLLMGIVTGALHLEVERVLQQAEIASYFSVIVGGDDVEQSKPQPDGYLQAIAAFNQQHPNLNLQPSECLAIEDDYVGIEAAKRAGIQVVGITNTYPLHMLQRQANWTVDSFSEIELERIDRVLSE